MARPDADVAIDAALVAALVTGRCPELEGGRITLLGSGWEYEAYAVGDMVLRLPRRAAAVPWLERELGVLALVGRALSGLVPEVTMVGSATDVFPYPFVGYARVPGVEATVPSAALASDLGRALGALHAVDAGAVPRTPDGWEDGDLAEEGVELARIGMHAARHLVGRLGELAAPYLAGAVPPPPRAPVGRLVHNDLCAEHVLVDPATGRLTGILDFSDAMVGDPAVDFVGLLTIGPHAFVGAVARAYPGALDAAHWARYGWIARVRTLTWLAEAAEDGEDLTRHLGWVARAFEPGPRSADGSCRAEARRSSVPAPSAEGT